MKRGGGRRYYRPEDVDLLRGIRWLLYSDGYTIKGVQRILRDNGVRYVKQCPPELADEAGGRRQAPEIPNLAGEAANEARRETAKRTESRQNMAGHAAKEAPGRHVWTNEQRMALQNVLRELEECREILQGLLPGQAR